MPQANPIISDDTVAAPPWRKLCAKVTLTGSVDCSRKPPIASIAVKPSRRQVRRQRQERHRRDQRPDDHAPRADAIGQRAAEEAADAAGEQVERHRRARFADRSALPRQQHRRERQKL